MYFSENIEKALQSVGQCVRTVSEGKTRCGYGVLSGAKGGENGGYSGESGYFAGQADLQNRLLVCETKLAFDLKRGDVVWVGDEKLTVIACETVHITDSASYARITVKKRTEGLN